MADNQDTPNNQPPDGLEDFLAEPTPQPGPTPDMNAAPIVTPVTQAVDAVGQRLGQMADVDNNLQGFNDLVTRARLGDVAAQEQLDQHMAGVAMGTVNFGEGDIPGGGPKSGPPGELGPEVNSGRAQRPLTDQASQIAETEKKGRELGVEKNKANALKIRKDKAAKSGGDPKKMATGGEVTAPDTTRAPAMAAPEGLDDFIAPEVNEEKYGSIGQQTITGVEGVAKGLAGPLATGAEKLLGVKSEDIQGREEANPVIHGTGEALGLAGPSLVSGGASLAARAGLEGAQAVAKGAEALHAVTQGGLAEKAGVAVSNLFGLGAETAPVLSKIGSKAVQGAVENALFQTGDEASRVILDPNQAPDAIGQAAMHVGLAGLIGGGLSGSIASVNPLWKATLGAKTEGVLGQVVSKVGGIEGVEHDPVAALVDQYGADLSPETKAALSDDPAVQQMASGLMQTDTNASGLAVQKSRANDLKNLGDSVVASLGHTPESIPQEVNKYETGKSIGKTLAEEYERQKAPIIEDLESVKSKYKDAPLLQDGVAKGGTYDTSNPYAPQIVPDLRTPGTVTSISEKLAQLADQEGWVGSKTDIENEMNRVMKVLPQKKTLSELTELITQVGNNTKSTLPFGMQTPLSRAGQLMKGILSEAEDQVALQHLGAEAPELIEKFEAARKSYRSLSLLKEQLDDRLHIGGSTNGFAKGLREMADTDGETLLNRISGKSDAHLLEFLGQNFPQTAEAVKQYHLADVLSKAAAKAKEGETISLPTLRKNIDAMSPQLRNFAIPGETQARIDGIGQMLDRLNKAPHNFSNTARTVDKLLNGVPGSALALATMVASHNPAAAVIVGALTKVLSKDAPDAVRLGLLRFLGSSKPVEGAGFKAMVDFIHASQKGESLLTNASKNIFKAGSKVIPEHLFPNDTDRSKLDKQVRALQVDPSGLEHVGTSTAHYMPEHGTAMAQTAATAVNYLNSIRPMDQKKNPLDSKPVVSSTAKAKYDRALAIAAQPLVVLQHLANGSMTSQDIMHLKSMYPGAYSQMAKSVTNQMMDAVNKGTEIPYRTKMGLSLFLGQPMDSTMTPQAIIGAQPVPKQQPQQSGGQSLNKPKRGTATLSKLPNNYRTPGQAAEADRGNRE